MIRTAFAASTLLLAALPASAQSQQEALVARYDRALAAGYKALMLCGAIANAERNGATRTPESVEQWELTGIQAPHDAIIGTLPYEIVRRPSGQIAHVAVRWADDMPARIAANFGPETGCSVLPIGAPEDSSNPDQPLPVAAQPEAKALGSGTVSASARSKAKAPHTLDRVFASALAGQYGDGTRTTATLVRYNRNGSGQVEQSFYAPGFGEKTPQRTWSVAKSIAATLIGAAVQSGEANVADPIALNYWVAGGETDPRNAITIDYALRMASGRYSDTPGNRTDPLYFGGSTIDETAVNWPVLNAPGTVFRYANNDTLLALKGIAQWLSFYPPHQFFAKLGMADTVAETDIRGDHVMSSQVWSTASDLADFGQLYLNNGVLPSGERVLPEGWAKYVSTPSGPQPDGAFGYGAGFWLMNRTEGVPADTFAAFGNRGQYVVIVPSRGVVIVRRGEDPAGSGFDIAAFTRDVLVALPTS
ncbi:serine hydrolase [Porphyrobacter sp. SLTP]|uniref:serine hydrolase domain-containing protein n=1 Tax=Porphyrobacter sp. SLTP TaxID=2683266 RepID=UPI00141278BF|nr:serine hydrolase [Porphyrobacter sp. SLTP]NBB24984.1 serine hydrolase [Porphyrobacter sp. SLTP]